MKDRCSLQVCFWCSFFPTKVEFYFHCPHVCSKCSVRKWSQEVQEALKRCLESTNWISLCQPDGDDINLVTEFVIDMINFCVGNFFLEKKNVKFKTKIWFKTSKIFWIVLCILFCKKIWFVKEKKVFDNVMIWGFVSSDPEAERWGSSLVWWFNEGKKKTQTQAAQVSRGKKSHTGSNWLETDNRHDFRQTEETRTQQGARDSGEFLYTEGHQGNETQLRAIKG